MELPLIDEVLLKNVTVASPCPARWEAMQGNERSRFCNECRLHVYNLSAMTAQQAAALIREKEGNLCARFYRREDGTILTADCPVGVRQRLRRQVQRAGALVAALLGVFVSIACDEGGGGRRSPAPLPERPRAEPIAGKIAVPREADPSPPLAKLPGSTAKQTDLKR